MLAYTYIYNVCAYICIFIKHQFIFILSTNLYNSYIFYRIFLHFYPYTEDITECICHADVYMIVYLNLLLLVLFYYILHTGLTCK